MHGGYVNNTMKMTLLLWIKKKMTRGNMELNNKGKIQEELGIPKF